MFESRQEGAGDDELGLRVMEVEMSHSHKRCPDSVRVQLNLVLPSGISASQAVQTDWETGTHPPLEVGWDQCEVLHGVLSFLDLRP